MSSADGNGARLAQLGGVICMWLVVWTVIFFTAAPGATKRTKLTILNASHGVVTTIVATATIAYGLDTTFSVATSVSYFMVDLSVMVNMDGFANLTSLTRTRLMDYVHHILGIIWGVALFTYEASTCAPALGNPYVWIQTNEVSTPFYTWFRLTNKTIAGVLFAITFFLSRIVYNTVYLLPRVWTECNASVLFGTAPFFALQYAWFAMIMRKILRSMKPAKDASISAAKFKKHQ